MRPRVLLILYAVFTLVLAHLSGYLDRTSEDDASIGGGGLLLLVLVVGLPWNLFYVFWEGETVTVGLATLLAGCAILNGILVYLLLSLRRSSKQP